MAVSNLGRVVDDIIIMMMMVFLSSCSKRERIKTTVSNRYLRREVRLDTMERGID